MINMADGMDTASAATGLGSYLVPGLGLAQFGLGLYGALKSSKAAKKAKKKQKRIIAMQLGELDKIASQFKPGGGAYEGAKTGLRTSQQLEVEDFMAQQGRSFVKTSTSGAVRTKKSAKFRGEQMALEDWLNEKYANVQREKAAVLGSIDVRGPSASSLAGAWENVGQGLGTLAQWGLSRTPNGKNMGSDITQMPEATVPLGPRMEPVIPAIETYMQGIIGGGLNTKVTEPAIDTYLRGVLSSGLSKRK